MDYFIVVNEMIVELVFVIAFDDILKMVDRV